MPAKTTYFSPALVSEIAALEPCYILDQGNLVRVHKRDGSTFLNHRSMKAVIRNICACYNADLRTLAANYGHYLHCKQDVPIPLSPALVLVRLKMRRPMYENDGATGYVNLRDVTGISAPGPDREQEASCLVDLKGGGSVPSLFSEDNVRRRLAMAKLALDRFLALQGRELKNEKIMKLLEDEMHEEEPFKILNVILKVLKP